ncbi:MAG: hypothetical protein ACTSPY_12415 [Candidatus Helarchaeota archaeon]
MNKESLKDLVEFYFRKTKNCKIDYNYTIDKQRKFDIIITKKKVNTDEEHKIGIFVCDIHRSIGLNVLRKIQYMLEDAEDINEAILVGRDFSSQVRKFYKSYDVKLLTQSEIKRNLEYTTKY